MDLKISVNDEFPCIVQYMTVNDVVAEISDFGRQVFDSNSKELFCTNLGFSVFLPRHSVLEKYNISTKEYFEVVQKLRDLLTISSCKLCQIRFSKIN